MPFSMARPPSNRLLHNDRPKIPFRYSLKNMQALTCFQTSQISYLSNAHWIWQNQNRHLSLTWKTGHPMSVLSVSSQSRVVSGEMTGINTTLGSGQIMPISLILKSREGTNFYFPVSPFYKMPSESLSNRMKMQQWSDFHPTPKPSDYYFWNRP